MERIGFWFYAGADPLVVAASEPGWSVSVNILAMLVFGALVELRERRAPLQEKPEESTEAE